MASPLAAHEFWIDPNPANPDVTEDISADLRVGQDLSGSALPFLETTIKAMTHFSPTASSPLGARLGDRPAITGVSLWNEGLHVLTVETHPSYIVFQTMPEFEEYLAYEGLADIAGLHSKLGLPDTEIAEEYIRNARALVQVGTVRGDDFDRPTGLPLEIIVTGTPFATGRRTISVRLEWRGDAVPGAQIALFHVPSGRSAPDDTIRTLARTDREGYAEFSLIGAGQYLLNAVRMNPVEGPGSVVWQSYWASLTFDIEEVH